MKTVVNESIPSGVGADEPCCCGPDAGRRMALKAVVAGTLVAASGIRIASAADDAASKELPRKGDLLVKVDDESKTPLTPEDLKLNEKQIIAWAYDPATKTLRDGSRLNRILLIKLDPKAMDDTTRARAADGVLAYSAFCTHQGCDVNAWLPAENAMLCFCHFSKFAPHKGAAVVNGPATRPQPALPLKVDNGKLVVADGFTAPPKKDV